jgi:antitoxin StbD
MYKTNNLKSIMNSFVPISRFNKGEANKIFNEVQENGFKIVLKNNTPACVLLTPEKYEAMLEVIENYKLYIEAEKRFKNAKPEDFLAEEKALYELGVSESDIDETDVEID